MPDRRAFLKDAASVATGVLFFGLPARARQSSTGSRRQVTVGGQRVKTIDIHSHCLVPEAWDLLKDYDWGAAVRAGLDGPLGRQQLIGHPERLRLMDEHGIDVQAVSINAFWYTAERSLARDLIQLQNEQMAAMCAAHPDRFVTLASVALQFPFLAADQLEAAVRKLGMRGAAIGGSVNGQELAARKFDPFWAKAEELGAVIFIHPQPGPGRPTERLQGNGGLTNVIGNPLETTIALSHLIFEGTLDRFPRLKICSAHAGGYLPSYSGRTDAQCGRGFPDCKSLKRRPSEYLKQLYIDSIIFTAQGLRHLIAEVGASQIIMGTDFPFAWSPVGVDPILKAPGVSDNDRIAILGSNAAKLLQIEPT